MHATGLFAAADEASQVLKEMVGLRYTAAQLRFAFVLLLELEAAPVRLYNDFEKGHDAGLPPRRPVRADSEDSIKGRSPNGMGAQRPLRPRLAFRGHMQAGNTERRARPCRRRRRTRIFHKTRPRRHQPADSLRTRNSMPPRPPMLRMRLGVGGAVESCFRTIFATPHPFPFAPLSPSPVSFLFTATHGSTALREDPLAAKHAR